jgi:hypothetical protein
MATELIPAAWKESVCSILRSPDEARILITQRARMDFFAQFPNAWNFNLYELLEHYLSQPDANGRLVSDLKPPGTAYDFICMYEGENVYAKINLLASGDVVLIVSAHRPLKGDTL